MEITGIYKETCECLMTFLEGSRDYNFSKMTRRLHMRVPISDTRVSMGGPASARQNYFYKVAKMKEKLCIKALIHL